MTTNDFRDRLWILVNELAEGKQNKFADLLGEHKSNVNRWLSPKYGLFPKEDALKKIADLQVNTHWLLTGEGEKYIKKDYVLNDEQAPYGVKPEAISGWKAAEILLNIKQLSKHNLDSLEIVLDSHLISEGKKKIKLVEDEVTHELRDIKYNKSA